ncbi:MAG: hypothetical protein FWE30_02800 [Bacteroidales bacterium]|nr:hypothetical protein [Bacteroidales bacterium]
MKRFPADVHPHNNTTVRQHNNDGAHHQRVAFVRMYLPACSFHCRFTGLMAHCVISLQKKPEKPVFSPVFSVVAHTGRAMVRVGSPDHACPPQRPP